MEFDNGSRGMLDLCMFAEGSKNEQEISVVGDIGKVNISLFSHSKDLLPLLYLVGQPPDEDTLKVNL